MITIKNLCKSFGSLDVIKDVSMQINDGEIYGIIGQSGAGKSTLLRCINGLETYQSGSVQIDGLEVQDLNKLGLRVLQKQMGMIFQSFNLLSRLDVYDNVALPLRFSGISTRSAASEKRIKHLIELVGLGDKIHTKPRELSGGQKQRVAIARALVLQPHILLCDEATSALDPQITQEILSLLLQIHQEMNLTIIIVTHQMEVVKRMCQRVSFLKDGSLLAEGKPSELFIKPNPDIRHFLGEGAMDDLLPKEGRNLRLFFLDHADKSPIITRLAREMNIDFSICWANLENFHDEIMGSLIINIADEDYEKATRYLKEKNVVIEEAV